MLSFSQKESMLGMLITHEFNPGDFIISEGDPGDLFYIIKKGSVSCSVKGLELRKLESGDFFGEQALVRSSQRTATVKALTKVTVLSLACNDLENIFGSRFQDIIYKNIFKICVEKSKVLNFLNESQVKELWNNGQILDFDKGSIVFKEGQAKGDKIVFVLKGELRNNDNVLPLFSCIGDNELKNGQSVFNET
jgi:cAMP-binding proteins - catabolite gene activator and regulatory subunit of cAMP-dependent protein kinases